MLTRVASRWIARPAGRAGWGPLMTVICFDNILAAG